MSRAASLLQTKGKSKYGMPIFLPNGNVNPAYLAAERKDMAAKKRKNVAATGAKVVSYIEKYAPYYYCQPAGSGYSQSLTVCVLFLEATGPFVNARWFLSAHGYKASALYLANGVVMFVLFFALRVVFNWWLAITRFVFQWDAFVGEQPRYIVAADLLFFPINLFLQLLWFQKIVKGILALLGGGAASKSKAK